MADVEFKYDISVVIPVYNKSKWLRGCIESVLSSEYPSEKIQIVLVDDDSKDDSYDICLEYTRKKRGSNIIARKIKHSGVSASRNEGIIASEGKYIMFLDADDTIHENAIRNIVRFFDMHSDETDAVICHYVYANPDGTFIPNPNPFKKVMLNSGIYGINDTMIYSDYALAVIKNRPLSEQTMFDTDLCLREDMEHLYRTAYEKGTIGYIKEAQYYKYSRCDSVRDDIRQDKLASESIAETAEAVLKICGNSEQPYAFAAGIINMLNSHLRDDSLWPHHFPAKRYKEYEERIKNILSLLPVRSFTDHPELDKYARSYWLKLKPNSNINIRIESGIIEILADGFMLERRMNVEWTLRRIRSRGSNVTVYGDFKLAAFDFIPLDEISFFARINSGKREKLRVKPSFFGYLGNSRMHTNNMWAFQFTVDAEKVNSLEIVVTISGVTFPAVIVNCANTVFNNTNSLTSATVGNVLVTENKKRILTFQMLNDEEVIEQRNAVTDLLSFDSFACYIRKKCNEYTGRRIWMYNDNFAMMNNGYYQFLHDVYIDDGIERYYVVKNHDLQDYKDADDFLRSHFVEYNSEEHILLFLNAERIFTAFTSGLEWRAVQFNEMYKYWDIFRAEVVLLSHGVLNQYWPWSFSPIRMCVDKVVISTFPEQRAWCENGFWQKDLIPSGMPRYSILAESVPKPPERKILMALSWRMYLAGKHEILLDAATSRIALDDKYINSSYFKNLMEFINSEHLEKILADNDMELDVNLHPQFNLIYRDHMHITNRRVKITDGNADLSEYMVMISDVSSIIFDFALYKRPILYFVPDIEEFKAGRNHFREVIIPFEDGLGPYACTAGDAVNELQKLADNDFVMEEKYRLRLEHHHIPLDGCCEKLYNYCMHEDDPEEITGATPQTVIPFMEKVNKQHSGKSLPLLKSIYDCIPLPYNKVLKSGIDRDMKDLEEYFDSVTDRRYVVCFAVSDTANVYWKDFIGRSGLGLKLNPGWRCSYIGLMDGGKIIYENTDRAALFYDWHEDSTGADISIQSRYFDVYEYPRAYAIIAVNGYNYSMDRRGVNVVVYDKETASVCDSFAIDLYADKETKILRY